MASPTATPKKIPTTLLIISGIFLLALVVSLVYLSRPVAPKPASGPSRDATAYLPNLTLSDVDMKATENFMKQQVVEVTGKITNNGPRTIQRIQVYCIFKGIDGKEVYRERVPVVKLGPQGGLGPKQTQSFRLPFDALPDTWNQSMPTLVIAEIVFAS